jgi:hypothetical protein
LLINANNQSASASAVNCHYSEQANQPPASVAEIAIVILALCFIDEQSICFAAAFVQVQFILTLCLIDEQSICFAAAFVQVQFILTLCLIDEQSICFAAALVQVHSASLLE